MGTPDVNLYGWRPEDDEEDKARDESPIHDHEDSAAVMDILRGRLQETIYPIDPNSWKETRSDQVKLPKIIRLLHCEAGLRWYVF